MTRSTCSTCISRNESYRESAGYRPGDRAVCADTPFAKIGMSICYDMRFPHALSGAGQGGAEILTMPAAFSPVTGAAHWQALLRARAIETGCFVIGPSADRDSSPAQRTRLVTPMAIRWLLPPGARCFWMRASRGVHLQVDLDGALKVASRTASQSCQSRDFEAP